MTKENKDQYIYKIGYCPCCGKPDAEAWYKLERLNCVCKGMKKNNSATKKSDELVGHIDMSKVGKRCRNKKGD